MSNSFHLAIPAGDLKKAEAFYTDILGCSLGRTSEKWIDFNFYGHQITAHLSPESFIKKDISNKVDGKDVPVRHFGVILEWDTWHQLSSNLKENNVDFIIDPYIRFKGEVGEQATMFFLDPSGNALEFKSFKDSSQVFAK